MDKVSSSDLYWEGQVAVDKKRNRWSAVQDNLEVHSVVWAPQILQGILCKEYVALCVDLFLEIRNGFCILMNCMTANCLTHLSRMQETNEELYMVIWVVFTYL